MVEERQGKIFPILSWRPAFSMGCLMSLYIFFRLLLALLLGFPYSQAFLWGGDHP